MDNESTFKGEEEVLFLPYQFFEITHIQKQSSNDKFGYYIISLKDIKWLYPMEEIFSLSGHFELFILIILDKKETND